MKTMKHTTKTNHKLLSLNDLGGGYRLCRNVFIHIYIQSLPQVSDKGTGGRLCAFENSINEKAVFRQ